MKRKIVNINSEKCNGCGLCVNACHEGAIKLKDGKAYLISDEYCDGLGDCLPECPTGAISIMERESKPYDEKLVKKTLLNKTKLQEKEKLPCGCPGTAAKKISRKPVEALNTKDEKSYDVQSELMQWPVQLKLVSSGAPYFKNADLLIAADCTAYAYAGFHKEFIKNHITVIGCPKLDDIEYYKEKIKEILSRNDIKSITVVRMEVPCCSGIVNAVKAAMLDSKTIVPYKEVIIGTEGSIL